MGETNVGLVRRLAGRFFSIPPEMTKRMLAEHDEIVKQKDARIAALEAALAATRADAEKQANRILSLVADRGTLIDQLGSMVRLADGCRHCSASARHDEARAAIARFLEGA